MHAPTNLLRLLAAAFLMISATAQAALNITPPQLAPDDQGVIATEVKSSLSTPTRWSVRVVPWDPGAIEPGTAAAMPVSALAAPTHPLGVEISPRFFSLAGQGRQVIRARIADRSRHYRLLIEQIPDDGLSNQGVNFRFRFSLPIYRSSKDPLIPRGVTIQ
ncbi:MAG: hypothetical protein FGM18_01335 [Burkholderiaceae bacterium]|nr:hypothetical protein [Burkholderiaceae bacterium]